MTDAITLHELFSRSLTEGQRLLLLREAQLPDDRPEQLRGQGGSIDEGVAWVTAHRRVLAALTLRYIDAPDHVITGLVTDGDLVVPSGRGALRTIVLDGFVPAEDQDDGLSGGFLVPDLTASSGLMLQALIDLAAANRPCGVQLSAPRVQLSQGSIQYAVGGGLFGSGVALLVACAAGLVGAPLVAGLGGAAFLTAGIVDLAVAWKKAAAETTKTANEATLLAKDIELKGYQAEMARLELERVRSTHGLPQSSEVPRLRIATTAEQLGWSEPYAHHVLNRALPNFRVLNQKMAGVRITVLEGAASKAPARFLPKA